MRQFDKMFSRTQGADFFRQAAFHLCLQYMNGALSADDCTIYYVALADKSFELVQIEVAALSRNTEEPVRGQEGTGRSFSETIRSLKSDITAVKSGMTP
jgi:hypothetical protein